MEPNYFIQNNKIGYGFWIWKPYIILKQLEIMKEGDILVQLDCDKEFIINTVQYQGGIILIMKNDITVNLIKEWYELCCNYDYINNNNSTIKNHRNDQSILSILCKKRLCE